MRAVILNGALAGDEGLTRLEQLLTAALASRGCEVEPIHLRKLSIAYCQGCFDCWVKTPGRCKAKDDAPDVTRAIVRSDLLVFLTPVTFGGYSSELKKALDRSISIVSPFYKRIHGEVHHQRRYVKYPSLLAVGVMRDHDEEDARIFSRLVERNAINMHAPRHAAGVVYRDEPDGAQKAIGSLVAKVFPGVRGAA